MLNFKENIATKISNVVNVDSSELQGYLEVPPNMELGDYAFPCFRLAKELKKAPNIIAQDIKDNIELGKELDKIEIVGGYLNFFVNKSIYAKEIIEKINTENEKYGSSTIKNNKNMVLEYSSPNIAKPMHMGHLRNTVIGGALYKIYKFLGYNVTGVNFLGDWGINFAKIMAGYSMWKEEYDFNNSLGDILKIYVRYSGLEKENPEYTEIARQWHVKLENNDKEALKLWNWIREISIKEAQNIYKLLDCDFDSYNGEAFYNDKMNDIVKELKDKNLLVESEGAKIVDLSEYGMPPCIIITSSGTTLYATRDIASLKYRAQTYNFDKAIYVVGSEQQLHFKQIFKVFELMGYENYAQNCEHVYYGMILDNEGKKMSTRKGKSLNLIDLLNEAIDKSKVIISEKKADIDDIDNLARQIGVGAVIFNSLYTTKTKDVVFDWDSVLNFVGETGPYVQYTYVRTNSVLNKAGYLPDFKAVNYDLYIEQESLEVIKLLGDFGEVIKSAAERNEPSILARYLVDLSQKFSSFYNEHHIICDDTNVQNARLLLTTSVRTVLKTGLELLGLEVPEKM